MRINIMKKVSIVITTRCYAMLHSESASLLPHGRLAPCKMAKTNALTSKLAGRYLHQSQLRYKPCTTHSPTGYFVLGCRPISIK